MKGADNEKLVRHVRSLNPTAKIVATAEMLASVDDLYAAGADYVTVTRLSDAHELYKVIEAAQAGLLEDKRAETDALLSERREVLAVAGDGGRPYRLLSCAMASAKAARRRAMKPAIRIAATSSQTVTAIGLST